MQKLMRIGILFLVVWSLATPILFLTSKESPVTFIWSLMVGWGAGHLLYSVELFTQPTPLAFTRTGIKQIRPLSAKILGAFTLFVSALFFFGAALLYTFQEQIF